MSLHLLPTVRRAPAHQAGGGDLSPAAGRPLCIGCRTQPTINGRFCSEACREIWLDRAQDCDADAEDES